MIRELMDELPGFATTGGQERFVLRHGLSFGARPQDVVDEERKNGIRHRKEGMTDAEGMLFEAEEDFQLNYVYPKAAADLNLAGIPLYRFEYDFDRKEKRLYRFWYVFRLGEGSSPSHCGLVRLFLQAFLTCFRVSPKATALHLRCVCDM